MKLKYYILISLFALIAQNSFAQSLNILSYGIEEGLPQSGINALSKDDYGNIWIGTMAGISKYNGLKFETFSRKNGLTENRVTCIVQKNNNLIIGHEKGGISYYNSATKSINEIKFNDFFLSKSITDIIWDDKNIWFATNGEGLINFKSTETNGITGKGVTNQLLFYEEGANKINQLIKVNNTLLIATEKGLLKLPLGDSRQNDLSKYVLPNEINNENITAIKAISDNEFWIGTSTKGLFYYNTLTNKLKNYSSGNGLSNNYIKNILVDSDNNLFVGTYGGGVFKFLSQLEKLNYKGPWFQTISTNQGLSNNKINCLMQDREKNIWIGTALYLNQFFDEQFEIYSDYEGLKHNIIWSVTQDKNNNSFWLGTEGGMVHFTPGSNSNKSIFEEIKDKDNSKIKNSAAICQDAKGKIWYSNFGKGLTIYDPAKKTFEYFDKTSGLPSNEIYDIKLDLKGNVWVGFSKGGVMMVDGNTGTKKYFTQNNGLGGNDVYTIFPDSKGRIWFGILAGYLTMYDNGVFKKYNEQNNYKTKFTVSINEDYENNIWFGTYEAGLYKFNNHTFTNYTVKDGASSDMPFLIQPDSRANLWIGTPSGIDKFNLRDKSFKHYGKYDGFLGVEINPNSSCKDRDGNLWFGTIIGLVKYNSKKEKNNTIEPIIYMKNPRVFFKETALPENNIYSYKQNHLTFDFVGASLTNPKRVKYKFMLEGMDEDWSPVTTQNYVTYPQLPPGVYTFWLKSANNDGIWNKKPVRFDFEVKPPFWQTWWFFISAAILIAIIIWIFIDFREKNLLARNKQLEDQVALRTVQLQNEKEYVQKQNVEISQQKIELENKNANITDSIDYAKRIQESIFTPTRTINKHLHDNFVLFLPKDIVSGDFYWMQHVGNETLFALADCTGHGVPGAFMSIIGYTILNDIVKDKKIVVPNLILDNLKLQMKETIHQRRDDNNLQDGMDLAMCRLNHTTGVLDFSGAFSSIFVLSNGELQELKGDKIFVGKTFFSKTGTFTNHQIQLQKGDMIYLFTDGYMDQVGGKQRRKFYKEPFRQLLKEINTLPAHEQKEQLQSALNNWKGKYEQIDDISVWGVRYV